MLIAKLAHALALAACLLAPLVAAGVDPLDRSLLVMEASGRIVLWMEVPACKQQPAAAGGGKLWPANWGALGHYWTGLSGPSRSERRLCARCCQKNGYNRGHLFEFQSRECWCAED